MRVGSGGQVNITAAYRKNEDKKTRRNVLVDAYYLTPSEEEIRDFFRKYANWETDELQAYESRTGRSWFGSQDYFGFIRDLEIIHEIIDDFFDRQVIKKTNLQWLQKLEKYIYPHLTAEKWGDREEIDLSKHKLVFVYYDIIHGLPLARLYREIYEELTAVLTGEERSVKKCPVCKKLFAPPQRGIPSEYCSAACRMRDYRKRKKQERLERAAS